jgi:hypothetical protein
MGGLGNQMFQYAYAFKLSKKFNTKLIVDTSLLNHINNNEIDTFRNYELHIFNIIFKNLIILNYLKYLIIIFNKLSIFNFSLLLNYVNLNLGYTPLKKNKKFNTIILTGYFQSEKYFIDCKQDLHKIFNYKPNLLDNDLIFNEIICKNSVSIHVRRGDYVSNTKYNNIHGVCTLKYYKNAVDYICNIQNNPYFYIFTDDISWSQIFFSTYFSNINFQIINTNNANIDFYLMKSCKHNIIANSSFSWWAAWLNQNNNKIVLAPTKWFNNVYSSEIDILPNEWIIINH